MTDRDLSRWRLVEDFKDRLKAAAAKPPPAATWSHPERLLDELTPGRCGR